MSGEYIKLLDLLRPLSFEISTSPLVAPYNATIRSPLETIFADEYFKPSSDKKEFCFLPVYLSGTNKWNVATIKAAVRWFRCASWKEGTLVPQANWLPLGCPQKKKNSLLSENGSHDTSLYFLRDDTYCCCLVILSLIRVRNFASLSCSAMLRKIKRLFIECVPLNISSTYTRTYCGCIVEETLCSPRFYPLCHEINRAAGYFIGFVRRRYHSMFKPLIDICIA